MYLVEDGGRDYHRHVLRRALPEDNMRGEDGSGSKVVVPIQVRVPLVYVRRMVYCRPTGSQECEVTPDAVPSVDFLDPPLFRFLLTLVDREESPGYLPPFFGLFIYPEP